jgi:hypothetical protein
MKEMVLSHHAASSQSLAQLIESAKGTGFDPEQEIVFKVARGGYVMQQAEAEDQAPPAEDLPDTEPFIPAPITMAEPPDANDARDDATDDDAKAPGEGEGQGEGQGEDDAHDDDEKGAPA